MSDAAQTDTRRWVALGLLAIAQFMGIADQTVVNIALPSIGADLGVSGVGLSWVAMYHAPSHTNSSGGLQHRRPDELLTGS